MEHLPQRLGQSKSIFPPIPYLCQHKYDEGPFLDYPQRLGLPRMVITATFRINPTLSHASTETMKTMSLADVQRFLQNWLFFGLLHEILGNLYCHEDYLTTSLDSETEKTVVTTLNLVSRLEEWEVKLTQDNRSLRSVYEHLAACITLAYASLKLDYPTFDHDLKFHLASVIEVLSYAINKACDVAWTDSPLRSMLPIHWEDVISEDFRRAVLLERSHCCPSQMEMLTRHFSSLQALSFVAACFNEDSVRLHHASCDHYACRARSSDADRMPHHVSDSCQCQFLHVDENRLVECLEKGSLPLLRIRDEVDTEEISMEVVASTDSTSYVALSHVWADGLGNSEATALPRCQVSRLKALIDNLDFEYTEQSSPLDDPGEKPELLMWCDSLCCPVASLKGKNMALMQMYRTYDDAAVVLVLDRSLISTRTSGMHPDEACIRIATSRWMTRLWTLQEGALPGRKNKLWFQFTKTALPASTLYNYITKVERTDIRRRGIASSVIGRFHLFLSLFDVQNIENRTARLENVMRGLMFRSVTVPSDEPLLVATLLNLDLSLILVSDPTERMNVLWRLMGTSPSGVDKDILFLRGLKLQQLGLKWAPQSLLSADYPFAIPMPGDKDSPGFLDDCSNPKGLVVELSGFRASIAKPAKGLPEYLAGFASLHRSNSDRYNLLSRDGDGRWYLLGAGMPASLEAICAVLSELTNPWILYRGSRSIVPENKKGHLGLLVEGAEEQQPHSNKTKYVQTRSHVEFCHLSTEMNQLCEAAYFLAQQLVSSAAARHLEDIWAVLTDQESSRYREALEAVDGEIKRLARSRFAMEALTASGNSADERGCIRIGEYMERIYRGLYVHVEEYVHCEQKWCVD